LASSFILYPKLVTIFLYSSSLLKISGSALYTIALYFLANSLIPSVSCFITDISCISHVGPLDEYIIFPKIGIFLIKILTAPIIFPLSSSANTISFIQFPFTFAHSGDC